MKKVYQKPQVYIESFELSEHIAGCNLELNQADAMHCDASGTIGSATLPLPNETRNWFIEGNGNCEVIVYDYCYTPSSSTLATINS